MDQKDTTQQAIGNDIKKSNISKANDVAMRFLTALSYFTSTYDSLHDRVSFIMQHKHKFYISPATKKLWTLLKDYSSLRNDIQHKYFATLSKLSDQIATKNKVKELEEKKDDLTEEEQNTLQTLKNRLESMDELQPFKIAAQDAKQISAAVSKFFNTLTHKINIKTVLKDIMRITSKVQNSSPGDSTLTKENQNGQLLH